jgi:hypothetical protein
MNTAPGKFKCVCKAGYQPDPADTTKCAEINPCLSHPCTDEHSICVKTGPAIFTCNCQDGYSQNGDKCVEINSCHNNPCDPHAVCIKTGPNTHVCLCDIGFQQTNDGKCAVYVAGQDPNLAKNISQSDRELRDQMEKLKEDEERKEFLMREAERARRIGELERRIVEFEHQRKERQQQQAAVAVDSLEKRVDAAEEATQQITEQKQQQIDLIKEMKKNEEEQQARIQELLRLKSDHVVELAQSQAQQLYDAAHPAPLPAESPIVTTEPQAYTDPTPAEIVIHYQAEVSEPAPEPVATATTESTASKPAQIVPKASIPDALPAQPLPAQQPTAVEATPVAETTPAEKPTAKPSVSKPEDIKALGDEPEYKDF